MMRPNVLVFAGVDPSGGAGLVADAQAVAAQGAHALTVVTALTVQDNDRVIKVYPAAAEVVREQAEALLAKCEVAAVKIGVVGNRTNAEVIADVLRGLRDRQPGVPIVLDPVLASGGGDALSCGDPAQALAPVLALATLITPNLPEAAALCNGEIDVHKQGHLLRKRCPNVLIKGGHGSGVDVVNRWFSDAGEHAWTMPRIPGSFHGTGCTLASAIAGRLACGATLRQAIEQGQAYCHHALAHAYSIAPGQRIPNRHHGKLAAADSRFNHMHSTCEVPQ